MRLRAPSELTFELPPRISWPVERRLTARAMAAWAAQRSGSQPPTAAGFERDEAALVTGHNSVRLSIIDGNLSVSSVGLTVSSALGLLCGSLTDAEPLLGSKLREMFTAACDASSPLSFDANLVSFESGAPLLTRGVMLPLLDANGELTKALAVMTWKEGLGATASDGLRDELSDAIAAGRAARRGNEEQLTRPFAQAFAATPSAGGHRTLRAWPVRPSAWASARQTCYRAAADA